MLDTANKKLLQRIVLTSLVVVTLIVAPYTLLDPINLPKLSTLAFVAVIALSVMLPVIKKLFRSEYRSLAILVFLFVFQIILVLLFSGANMGAQFYGTFSRNTGALAYISLAILLLSSSLVSDKEFLKRFVNVTLIIGAFLIFYGNIQYLGLEPFPYTNAYTVNAPTGTFGNSNFQSAFMGLIATVAFAMALNFAYTILVRIGLAVMGFAAVVVIYETLSDQGYLNLMAGVGVVAMVWLFMSKRKVIGLAVAGLGVIGGGLVFLALINQGPFAQYIYNSSIIARGYYWKAALKMLTDHPIFGVGMDGYINWYRRSRPADYLENGFVSYSDSAHNVFLDIASSGGFALLAIYIAIAGMVILSIVRVVQRTDGFDPFFVAIVGAWAAYHVQSLVSINQLGLAIWGWVLSGLIIGFEINTRVKDVSKDTPTKIKSTGKKARASTQPLSSKAILSLFAGVVTASLIAGPLYFVNSNFYTAIRSSDIKAIESAAQQRPRDERRLYALAGIFRDNQADVQAVTVLRDATKRYPDSFDLWTLWTTIPTASPSDIASAKAQLKRLDPFNPDLK